ncbi:hypothetical protein QZH56_15785 [Streptomyces olivoreticuli]|nr:hypothetical protein [Streptomyces olivoreticuli]WKK21920.1 hypothetical protein QZH56_24280 [Streptomyces olivoreticuli]WKK26923.1 hypothetical protein QZH56_15785 [Streptomyces olivoreticuli]
MTRPSLRVTTVRALPAEVQSGQLRSTRKLETASTTIQAGSSGTRVRR